MCVFRMNKLAPRAFFAAIFAWALFASCDFGFNDDSFQNKAGAYFKEMTSTAAVVSYNVTKGSALTDKYGNLCFGYDEDHVVTLSLRNPQHYSFKYGTNMFMTLAGNTGKTQLDQASLVKIEQNSSDTTKLVITFPQDFLNANPLGADISPTVTLMHPVSFAQFTPYNGLKLSSNSPPPTPAGAVAMQTTETPSRWVVCFNFPNAGVVKKYHSDLQSMTIEGQSVSISVNDGAISYQGSSAISSAPPATIVANQNTGVSFKASGQPVYFATGDEADEKEKYYEVKITDNAGLSTEYKVSTRGFKLSSPKAYVTDDSSYSSPFSEDGGKNYISQEDDGSSFITIRAEAKTAQVSYTGKDGSTKVVEQTDYDPANAKMFWEVYLDAECTQLVNSGIIKGLVGKIAVPAGTSYVRSYVQKPLYSDSETVTWFCRAVSTKFYISETGDNIANTGSRSSPYRTIQFAVDKFADGMIQGDYEADCKCRIILLDNLTVPSDFNFDANDGYLIKIPTAISTATVSVEGDGGEKTITLPGSSGLRRLFLYALSGETELKNIAVTGASGNASAPIAITAAGTKLRLASSRISGCNLLCADGETAYMIANYGTLEMSGAAMRDNTASRSGSGTAPTFNLVFNRGTAKITNSEFSGHGSLWNIIDNEGSLEVTGGSIKDNACARSIRNRAGTATLAGLAVQNSANIWNGAALVMEGCSVTGNSSEGLGSGVYLEDTASATLTLKGANTIYDNHSAADPAKQSNVYVPYGKAIEVGGNISGSKVGVYMPFTDTTKPTLTAPVAFTHGYGYGSTNPLKPGRAFWGDNGYGVAVMESGAALGEAAFAVSSGSMYGASDYSFDFAAADEAGNTVTHVYQPNTADVVITVTPTVQRSNAVAGTQDLWYAHPLLYADSAHAEEATGQNKAVEWTAALYNSGMPALTLSVAGTADGSGIRVTLPVSSFTGEYTLKVRAKFLGLYHDFNLPVSFGQEGPSMSVVPISSLSEPPTAATYPLLSLSTSEEFDTLAEWSKTVDFEGITITLQNDVTTSKDLAIWQFKGTFDGDGHTVTQNMTQDLSSGSETLPGGTSIYKSQIALFWNVSGDAVIKNLKTAGNATRAGLVGAMNGGTVENCVNEATVKTTKTAFIQIAGIVNNLKGGTVRNCINRGALQGATAGSTGGGIAYSVSNAVVENCVNYGEITSCYGAAGVVFYMDANGIVRNSQNKGNITVQGHAGGVIGSTALQIVKIYNCGNSGNLTTTGSTLKTGGLIGRILNVYKTLVVSNNCNTGEAQVGFIGNFGGSSSTERPEQFSHNYSIIGSSPLPTTNLGDKESSAAFTWEINFDTGEISGFDSSEAETVRGELNQWALDNSDSTVTYKQWKSGANGPELDLDAVEDAINAVFGD